MLFTGPRVQTFLSGLSVSVFVFRELFNIQSRRATCFELFVKDEIELDVLLLIPAF